MQKASSEGDGGLLWCKEIVNVSPGGKDFHAQGSPVYDSSVKGTLVCSRVSPEERS